MRPAKQYEYKDYTGSFRLSKADAEKALAFAKSKDWSVSKLIRRSIAAMIDAEQKQENTAA
jgi:hypothetical protein